MPTAKLQRTVNSVNEHLVSLRNSEISRESSLGTNWSKVRLGIRCGFAAVESHGDITSDNQFYIGLLTDAFNGRGDVGNCPHFVGVYPSLFNNTFTYDSGASAYYNNGHDTHTAAKANKVESGASTTSTLSTSGMGAYTDVRINIGALPSKLINFFVDFQKGSPWTVTIHYEAGQSPPNNSNSDLESGMLISSPGSLSLSTTLSIDETTYGNLVIPTVFWENQTSHYFEIADFYVALLA